MYLCSFKRITGLLCAATIGVTTALASGAAGGSDRCNLNVDAGRQIYSNSIGNKESNLIADIARAKSQQVMSKKRGSVKTDSLDEKYRKSGDAKLSDGDLNGALDEYDKALQLNPKNAMAHYGRGRVHLATASYSEALTDLNRAVAIDPDFTSAHIARIGILMYKRDFSSALIDASKVVQLEPDNALAFYERGLCNGEVGNRIAAINDLCRARALLSQSGDSMGCEFINFSLSKQYQENGRYAAYQKEYQTALENFNQAISVNPGSASTLLARAAVEHEMGSDQAALSDYDRAIEVAPLLADAYKQRGTFYYETNAYELAQVDLTRALTMSPTDPELYNCRGLALEAMGKTDAASADYKKASLVAKVHSKHDADTLTREITELIMKV